MATSGGWCSVCRGDAESHDDLIKCRGCKTKYHLNCAGLRAWPDSKEWRCDGCVGSDSKNSGLQKRIRAVRAVHKEISSRAAGFFEQNKAALAPFVSADAMARLTAGGAAVLAKAKPLTIGAHEPYIKAQLRAYQCEGVNWLLAQYAVGTGGILGDEMGLGKTIQTLAFLSRLKAAGLPGPHLVVTPLAVLQNWANELKRFTPELSFVKIYGSASERDRLLNSAAVVQAEYDVYLTTYDTLRAEEAFFTEAFLFHTITIDEGHRLKNEASSLCASLARLPIPFRLLLTGTPLQNNLHELWALLSYILPGTLSSESFDGAARVGLDGGQMDHSAVAQARLLLESLMLRRVKSQVETSLLPKVEYVLKPPLMPLQRAWYRRLLQTASADDVLEGGGLEGGGGSGGSDGSDGSGLLTVAQLQSRLMQLQKVCNHPKAIALTIDRDRAAAAAKHAAAAGSSFIKLPPMDSSHLSAAAREDEATLRALVGPSLIAASGKLAMLDRLLVRCKAAGSRALIFSQYTLSLDVLEEYVADRWGARGRAYFRLDGTTNRIAREMDMRSFNAPGSEAFLYLISTRAGGQGINLATADVVVLYDTCYNPQVDLQAQDRAHRIGQTKQVKIYRLISPSTFEERVLLRARQKLLLDALVIKKAGEGGAGVALLEAADEGDEGGDMGKLSVQELYRMLSHGADAVFDPTADLRPPPTAEEIDAMLDAAKPANVHDDLEEAGGEAAEELAEEGPQQAAQQAAPQPMHGYRCGRCGLPKKGHVCGAGVAGATAPSVSAEARGEGLQPLTTAEDEWEPPPTTRSHAELVAEVKEHMAALGLTQKQFAQRVAGQRLAKSNVSFWLKLCGGLLKPEKLAWIDRLVAAYLDDPERVSARFLKADDAGADEAKADEAEAEADEVAEAEAAEEWAAEDEWEPPPTTRSHAELVAEVKEHMATLGLTQKQFAQRVAGRRLRQAYVSHWLKLCGGQLKVHTISWIDRLVAAYLDDPEGVSARFLKADEAGAAPAKWEPPPTSREHSELVQAIQEHIVTQRYTQAQLGARMGKNASTMSQWLLGKVPPGPCAKLDARAAAYLADPEGVAARCAADAAAADAAAAAAAAAREVQKREAEARALAARVGHKRKAAPPDRFSPPRIGDSRAPRATLHHDDWCFSCGDGGEIIECTVCPRSYHLSCVHLTEVPKGSWYCPWHACWECARKSTDVGGQLFHCMTCPLTYCFDCAPDAYTEGNAVRTAEATATSAMLEQRGIQSTKSYLFFHCDDCKTERRKPPVPVTLKRARAATEAGPTVGDEAAPAEGGAGGAEGGSDAGVPDVVELANLKAAWRYELDGTQVRVEQHEFHRLEKGVQLTDSGKGFTRDFASAIFSDVEVLETRQQESAKWLQSMNKKLKEPIPQSYKGEWQLRLERSSAGVASEAELSQKVHAARSEAGVAQHAMMEASATEAAAVPLAPLDELLEKGTLRREDEPTAAPEPKKPRTSIGLADADSPERSEKLLASLAEYLETCGGSAEMIIGWYTKTGWYNKQGATEGTTYSYFINTQVSRIAAPSWAHSRAEPCR